MRSNLWIGIIAGAAGTLLVVGGITVVSAAGGMGAMSMEAMMEQCRQMMSSHAHGGSP